MLAKVRRLLRGGYSRNQVVQRLSRTPLQPALRWLADRRDPAGKRRRRLALRHLPPPPAALANLERLGFAPAGDWIAAPTLRAALDAARDAAEEWEARARQDGVKEFFAYLLQCRDATPPLASDQPFVRLALDPGLLGLAARYFGEAPYLFDLAILRSRGTGAPLKVSQLWHRDFDDRRMLKLFLYLTDVPTPAQGPFTFFDASLSGRIGLYGRNHLPDVEVLPRLGGQPRQQLGPAGTAFLVDTARCLHMGSRVAPGETRIMLIATYVKAPPLYRDGGNAIRPAGELSELQRLALQA